MFDITMRCIYNQLRPPMSEWSGLISLALNYQSTVISLHLQKKGGAYKSMRNSLRIVGIGLALTAMMSFAGLAMAEETMSHEGMSHEGMAKAETKTIQGEVIDTQCYAEHGMKGEQHAECAEKCIKGGSPVGLLDKDGNLYIVLGAGHKAASEVVKGHIGHIVKATGEVHESGGAKFIVVSSLTHVSGGKPESKTETKSETKTEKTTTKKSTSAY
jgi:hypothetical protein